MSSFSSLVDMFFGASPASSIAGVRIDAVMSEQLTLDSDISQYPRENGGPFTDGIIPSLPVIEIDGVVTNANVMFLDGLLSTGSFATVGDSKLVAARKALENVHKQRQPVSIVTSGVTYTQYGMASCSIVRRGDGVDGELSIRARFVYMPTVSLKNSSISVTNKASVSTLNNAQGRAGGTKAAAGQVGGTTATIKDTPSPTAAKALFTWAKGL